MSPNRKAELQRKLTLAPIPKPPAGLADRIKDEIPKKLAFDAEHAPLVAAQKKYEAEQLPARFAAWEKSEAATAIPVAIRLAAGQRASSGSSTG